MSATPTPTPDAHAEAEEHDGRLLSDPLDRTFVQAWVKGYVLGLFVFGGFVFATIYFMGDQPVGVSAAIALAVSFWVGLLAAVVLVGVWTMRNEHELFGRSGSAGH